MQLLHKAIFILVQGQHPRLACVFDITLTDSTLRTSAQKQNHILEAGPNGREQLAGSSQAPEDAEDDKDKEEEVVKDKAYYDKVVSARKREFTFRINFILLLTDPTGTLEEKKIKSTYTIERRSKILPPLRSHGGV